MLSPTLTLNSSSAQRAGKPHQVSKISQHGGKALSPLRAPLRPSWLVTNVGRSTKAAQAAVSWRYGLGSHILSASARAMIDLPFFTKLSARREHLGLQRAQDEIREQSRRHEARSVLELTVLHISALGLLTCLQSRQAPAGEHLGFRRARGEIRE